MFSSPSCFPPFADAGGPGRRARRPHLVGRAHWKAWPVPTTEKQARHAMTKQIKKWMSAVAGVAGGMLTLQMGGAVQAAPAVTQSVTNTATGQTKTQLVHAVATVKSVNKGDRSVVLKKDNGEEMTVEVPAVRDGVRARQARRQGRRRLLRVAGHLDGPDRDQAEHDRTQGAGGRHGRRHHWPRAEDDGRGRERRSRRQHRSPSRARRGTCGPSTWRTPPTRRSCPT